MKTNRKFIQPCLTNAARVNKKRLLLVYVLYAYAHAPLKKSFVCAQLIKIYHIFGLPGQTAYVVSHFCAQAVFKLTSKNTSFTCKKFPQTIFTAHVRRNQTNWRHISFLRVKNAFLEVYLSWLGTVSWNGTFIFQTEKLNV